MRMPVDSGKKGNLLAVASAGGHWVQLMRLRPSMIDYNAVFLTTNAGLKQQVPDNPCVIVRDASMWERTAMLIMASQIFWAILKVRPRVVISTGAAPGFFAIFFGRLIGAKTVWIDSIANSEELSLAGKKVGRFAHYWLTQWPELEKPGGPTYLGAVL